MASLIPKVRNVAPGSVAPAVAQAVTKDLEVEVTAVGSLSWLLVAPLRVHLLAFIQPIGRPLRLGALLV